jgi:helix-turn-helix protein
VPKIWRELNRQGIAVTRCTLEWLMRELGICVLVHPPSASSAIKFNRQTEGSFVRVRPTVGLSATGSQWRNTRENRRSMTLGRSVMKRIRIGRRRFRSERPWLEALSPDPRDPDIVRAKALARTARSREAPGK